jgi:hypothetical protein
MPGKPARWLTAIAAASLMAAGLSGVISAPAQAASGTLQTGPFEVGNLLNYANSDFEGTTGNWASVSNATLTDDPNHQFLHDASLLDTATSAGTSSFKVGNGSPTIQINVTGGDKYRVGAYFKAPAVNGQTVQFSLGCYTSGGTWIGAESDPASTLLNTTKWQYSESVITLPSNCAYVLGAPEVILGGLAAGAAVNMDEAIFAPKRAALIIGAHGENGLDGGTSYTGQDWIDTNWTDEATNTYNIGPLQSDKEFYGGASPTLPGSWTDSSNRCYQIEEQISNSANWPACVVNLHDFETEGQIAAYFTGLPAAQMVVMIYHDEPEGDTFSGCGTASGDAANYICYFDEESANIHLAAADANSYSDTPSVFVAADSSTYEYGSQSNDDAGDPPGGGCPYIPPTTSTDFYLADHYDQGASGNSLPNETGGAAGDTNGQKWQNWLNCVQSINKPLGLAEYGLDCSSNPDQSVVTTQMGADKSYLGAIPGATEPTIMWAYWYNDAGNEQPGCVFDNSAGGITAWQGIETQNGGG